MLSLNRKVLRDLLHLRGQALAIALVISSGAATYIMSVSTLETLMATRAAFYRDYRFAEVFAEFKRAPRTVAERIAEIPGVQQVEARVVAAARLQVAGFDEPVSAQIVSVPDSGPLLNQLFLRNGRLPDRALDNEVVISEAFAQAHSLQVDDTLSATINGRQRRLRIVGIALSPEFIYQLQPGSMIPDFRGFGVLWMAEDPLESAYNMQGAANSLTATLAPNASLENVIDRIDIVLEPYGGRGAYGRGDQLSHRYLSDEFRSLKQMATVFPLIFYGVAAFLLNVVVTRLIATQREQVAVLKAFGYGTLEIVLHYLKLIVVIVLVGVVGGIGLGTWMGRGMSGLYMEFYRFPYLIYSADVRVFLIAALVSCVAAVLGTVVSVYNAAKLPPAVAMQPPAPPKYRRSLLERFPLAARLSQPTRMIVRNLERRPFKSMLTVLGTAMACAILVMGGFFSDAFDYIVTVQLKIAQRDDLMVSFVEPTSRRAMYSLVSMPGVEYAEPYRAVPIRLRHGHKAERTSIQGLVNDGALRQLLNDELAPVSLPASGILLTDHLAATLDAKPGDQLTVEVLEGQRRVVQVPLAATIKEFIGVSAYMQLDALNRLMREGPAISGAYLQTASGAEDRVYQGLREMPRVAGASIRENVLRNFYDTMAKQALTFAFFNTVLAGCIAFGVVYNSVRIAFAERSRELASLRVLGLTRGEVSYILLGELAILTLLAIPAGFLIGRGLSNFMVAGFQTDLYRIPLIIEPGTYTFAAVVVLVSSVVSALMILRKINRLDLVEVLKTRE